MGGPGSGRHKGIGGHTFAQTARQAKRGGKQGRPRTKTPIKTNRKEDKRLRRLFPSHG